MADVNINIFTNKVYKQGASTVVPGFIEGEEPTPINPSGSGGASEFVPYVGATENFDLGEFGMSAGFLKLDTTPTNTPTDQGTMYWDEDDNTVDIILNGYIMKVGEDLFYPVKNQTGSSIAKGTNVGFAGTLGMSGRLLITPYLANGANPTSRYMGVTAETIANGDDGKVLWFGRIRGINTNAFNEGDILYASTSSAGAFQTTLPVAPNNIVEVAAVVTKSSTQGVIFVRPQFLAVADSNKVSYNVADIKNTTEKNQARVNIGSTSSTAQIVSSGGVINDLAVTSNHLVVTGANTQITGIVAGLDGEEITIFNNSGTNCSLIGNSPLSTSTNRFGDTVTLPNFRIVRIKYRTGTDNRWWPEFVGLSDNRYLRKDITDTKTGDIALTTDTGTKIGTATNQKLGFFNATPIVQPSGNVVTALQNLGLVASASLFSGLTTDRIVKATSATTIGDGILADDSFGVYNTGKGDSTFFGYEAGLNDDGTNNANVFVGYRTGKFNTTGFGNSFYGIFSGLSNTTGSGNAFFGYNAGGNNTNQNDNSYFGHLAGVSIVTGQNNCFFGKSAGMYVTGDFSLTSADNSVFIGMNSRAKASLQTNQIVIGYDTTGEGSNTILIGNTSITDNYIRGNFNITDGRNLIIGTTTGTKIGTATSQKLSFWNATPIVQPTTAIAESAFVENSGGVNVNDDSTFDGYTLRQVVKALRDAGLLA
jgi:hypothetical protein